jgi:hypothetical protein
LTLRPEFSKRNSNNAAIPGWMLQTTKEYIGVRTPWFAVKISLKYIGVYWSPNLDRHDGDLLWIQSKFWEF